MLCVCRPRPLAEMLGTIPKGWTVVNGSPTHSNRDTDDDDDSAAAHSSSAQSFAEGHFYRLWDQLRDWGAVAVIYHMANPATCKAWESGKTEIEVMTVIITV
jgi:putative heme iron utilization protein